MSGRAPLAGVVVTAVGRRLAVSACASLLARMGASVVFVDEAGAPPRPAGFIHGCTSVAWVHDSTDEAVGAIRSAHVVLHSRDDGTNFPESLRDASAACAIRCDITALGRPDSDGLPWSDADLQAAAGIMDVTGLPDGGPCQVGLPIVELSGALYAAASVAIAVQVYRKTGRRQVLDCCLYDAAFNALATFLPAYLGGTPPRRLGNQHPLSAPWDAFLSDAWLLVCTVSDEQWRRLARLMGGDALARDTRFDSLEKRLHARDGLNALVGEWVRSAPADRRESELLAAGIPCGRVARLAALMHEPNLAFRGAVEHLSCGVSVAGGLSGAPDWWRPHDRAASPALAAMTPSAASSATAEIQLPFAGLRVLEIGQYTTAPLVARHLASLGATVLKIEPTAGDTARAYLPAQDGTSLFFTMTNSGKTSVRLDLGSADGRDCFGELVRSADVLVENLKPDALARLGFGVRTLRELNPRLVYAAISGFGARSLHHGRPAYDTVIQAMSGIMDATRQDGTPLKAGVSIADIAGGQMGLLAVIGALIERESSGEGRFLDVSMQDACAWLVQLAWNGDWESPPPSREVRTIAQVCESSLTRERQLLVPVRDGAGRTWHLLGSPIALSGRRPRLGPCEMRALSPSQARDWWRSCAPAPDTHEHLLEHS